MNIEVCPKVSFKATLQEGRGGGQGKRELSIFTFQTLPCEIFTKVTRDGG